MSETKTLHRNFWVWEFEKEERWLNEMAQEGWALQNAGFCTYTFEKDGTRPVHHPACHAGQFPGF